MAIKSDTGKLFLLLNKCVPGNQFIERTLLIEKIREMQEYRELRLYAPAKKLFLSMLDEDRLKETETEKLQKIYESIPFIATAIESIIRFIHSGDVSSISEDDAPNYCDADSLERTIEKFSDTSELENYTNIDDSDFEVIFCPNTVKSLGEYAKTLSSSEISDIYNVIRKQYEGKYYCIPSKEIKSVKKGLISILPKLIERNNELKKEKRRFSLLKILYAILSGFLFVLLVKLNVFYGLGIIVYLVVSFIPLILLVVLG